MSRMSRGYAVIVLTALGLLVGCPAEEPPFGIVPPDEAFHVGAQACSACHANIASLHSRTAHAHAFSAVFSQPPVFPAPAPGVPQPPPGLEWQDIAYVIGGYGKAARFVDTQGFQVTGPRAQYNLAVPQILLEAGFVPYLPAAGGPVPLAFEDFARLTTGAAPLADSGGRRQDNRPGIEGTWAEDGIQCEACHGPGSLHVPNPTAGNIILDGTSGSCARCHADPARPEAIATGGGLIEGFQQSAEVAVSPHASFSCSVCHDPHASPQYDRSAAIRNRCQACHPKTSMALHAGLVYVVDDYVEEVTCESCHMPFAVRTRWQNVIELTNGTTALLGDTRSHIMALDPTFEGLIRMFDQSGDAVAGDEGARARLSTCYVCLRCHNGLGNAFAFPAAEGCAFGAGIHAR